ncbi:unnamed protein product [Leptidea sinapis]|uniref:PIN domain-containing protein n=1 Tax=Leptidea sinapis TaxID=189913 RepID=A0A5E4QZQ6_9NEOP|nr:unnamed protein product [Leptidea sinapis]
MKNGCHEYFDTKIADRSEQAKKVYRYVTDVARRVGEVTSGSKEIADLFTVQIEIQRQKLRDNCEKLFFLDPLNYGKKSLELLWRKVYYDTISSAKKLRESNSQYDGYIQLLIAGGIGQFHHFMARIQADMKVQIKDLDYSPLYYDEENEEDMNKETPEDENQLGRTVLYSCLIYLGDLSRYQIEIFNNFEASVAARYYLQAAQIDLSSGMPFNQLGNLYLDKNYNLDSVSSYIHCLSCLIPFEGALGNLNKIFEKNNQFCNTVVDMETCTQSEHLQHTIANFFYLIEKWYFGKDDINISKMCSNVMQQLKIAMDFKRIPYPDINKNFDDYTQAVDEENTNPSYLNLNMIHNIVKICLFTLVRVKEIDESKAFSCKAFTLAFLSQILQKLHTQLEALGLKNPATKYYSKFKSNIINTDLKPISDDAEIEKTSEKKIEETLINDNSDEHKEEKESVSDDGIEATISNGDVKKKTPRRRRRRRVTSSESSNKSDTDSDDSEVMSDNNCSEDEDLSDSSYHSEDDPSETSVSDNEYVEEKSLPTNKEQTIKVPNKTDTVPQSNINNGIENEIDVDGIKNFLLGENFLPSLKLLQDWAMTEKDLILSCGDSGEALFQCVVNLLNIFNHYFDHINNNTFADSKLHILVKAQNIAKKFKLEFKSIPLPEDINLRGTNIGKFDKDAAEWQIMDKLKPTVCEENIIRILNFIDFGNQIAKIVPRIKFNRTLKIFYLKKVYSLKVNTKLNHKRSREWHNSKKIVSRLWLASRVQELECTGQAEGPSLLAVDTSTLQKHLRRVKQLVKTKNFIFLVPTIVLQELDELKRDCSAARDAIRWLEFQLKSGCRFLRTQRPGQSKPLPLLKCPRKAPPFVHNFLQILEFCNHFTEEKQSQGGNGDPESTIQAKSAPLLVLLVGIELGKSEEQYKDFSLIGAAQSAGVSIEHIGEFYTKWRHSNHKNSKKR